MLFTLTCNNMNLSLNNIILQVSGLEGNSLDVVSIAHTVFLRFKI